MATKPKAKPELHLVPTHGKTDLDQLADLYEKLTGKRPTPDEMVEARDWLKGKNGSAGRQAAD